MCWEKNVSFKLLVFDCVARWPSTFLIVGRLLKVKESFEVTYYFPSISPAKMLLTQSRKTYTPIFLQIGSACSLDCVHRYIFSRSFENRSFFPHWSWSWSWERIITFNRRYINFWMNEWKSREHSGAIVVVNKELSKHLRRSNKNKQCHFLTTKAT